MTEPTAIRINSLAPILVVAAIEPSLPFWVDRLGFSLEARVPEACPYNFAIVARDGVRVMLQTRASVQEDTPGAAEKLFCSVVYVSVASLDPIVAALDGCPVAVPRRRTFYGADEIFVRDPAGNMIGFAAFGSP